MAGKVAEIRDLLKSEALANNISELFVTWNILRQEKLDELSELRNYIFATDTTKTTNSKLSWKNTTTIPKITQIRDNLHANYMAALFPNNDWLKWEAYTEQSADVKKARVIRSYMYNKIRESNFKQTISKLLYDWIDTGNVFSSVSFSKEYKEDPITGEKIANYIGPVVERTSIYDHIFNPVASCYKKSPKITRYITSLGELEDELEDNPNSQYIRDAIIKAKEVRNALSTFKVEDINKAEAYAIDGFGNLQDYFQSGYVELLEFEGDIYDPDEGIFMDNMLITILDRQWVVRKSKNTSWLCDGYRQHVGWRERPDNLYAMGPLDNLVGLQYRLDHLENLKADALDLTIHPPLVVKGDVEPFTYAPLEIIHITEDGEVSSLAPNVAAFQVNNEIYYIMSLMEEMAGAPKEAMGIRTPGEKTAFEVQSLMTAAGRIFQDKASKFEEEYLEPLLNAMLEISVREMDTSDVVRVMDEDFGVEEFLTITKEDITAKGRLRPIGARHFAAQQQMMQNLVGLSNTPIWQQISPHISAKNLAKKVEDLLLLDRTSIIRDNIGIIEQAETQRLVNQAQEDIAAESMTPTSSQPQVPME